MNTNLEHPYNRRQMFLGGIADITDDIPDTRYDRDELYYAAIYNRVKGMDEDIDVLERKVAAMATDMKYKGSVEDYDHLPTNAKKGDVYTTLDDGREYVYDGDQWVEISSKVDVVQDTGQSTTDVMSQKAVTDALAGCSGGKVFTIATTKSNINASDTDDYKTLCDFFLSSCKGEGPVLSIYLDKDSSSSAVRSKYGILSAKNVTLSNNYYVVRVQGISSTTHDSSDDYYGCQYTQYASYAYLVDSGSNHAFYISKAEVDNGEVTHIYSIDPSHLATNIHFYGYDDKILKASMDGYPLGIGNTTAYIPTGDYNPATKKYVDDAVAGGGGGSTVPMTFELLQSFEGLDYDEEMSAADVIAALGGETAATTFFQAIRDGATPKCDITIDEYYVIMNTMVSSMTPDSIQIFIPGEKAIMAFNMSGETTTDGMVKNSPYPISN